MNYYQISGAINCITSGIIFVFILINNPRSPTNRSLAYFSFIVSAWSFFYQIWVVGTSYDSTLHYMRISVSLTMLMPVTFVHFILNLTNEYSKHKYKLYLLYIYSLLLYSFQFSNLFIADAQPNKFFNFWPVPGPVYYLNILNHIVFFNLGLRHLWLKIKSSDKTKSRQLEFVFWGTLMGYVGGETNFLTHFITNFPPIGNIIVSIYCILITYAVLKHGLMDIRVIIKKSIVYTLLITIISLIYFISILATEKLLQSYLKYDSYFISFLITTIIALIFIPLKDSLQKLIDKLFFKKSINELEKENQNLLQEVANTQRLKSIAILASGLAHEIKNPLTPIKTFAEYLPTKINDKEFLSKFSVIINKEVNRINELVNELLDFAKPSSPELKPVRINDLINNIIELLNNNAIKNNIHVVKEINPPYDTTILIDPKQIKQALLNILLNAIEVMPNGGTLCIKAQSNNTEFTITISDSGPGIDKKDLPHIFDPFFTKKDGGTGLGLSITHEIIKNHKGRIIVESSLGNGATFIIKLPN